MTDLPASTSPAAVLHPLVQGRCPACNGTSLFLGSGGYVTCSRLDCSDPSAADDLLHGQQRALAAPYPDYDEWLVQMLLDDGTWGTWLVGPDRDKARERIRARRSENPNETFRLVRMTTVHTVEDDT